MTISRIYTRERGQLDEMRTDLRRHTRFAVSFIILPKGVSFWYPNDRVIFTYFIEEHEDIGNKLRIPENHALISDIRAQ